MRIYLICKKSRPVGMIKSGQEPEDFIEGINRGKKPEEFLKRVDKGKSIIILERKDIKDIIELNKRG